MCTAAQPTARRQHRDPLVAPGRSFGTSPSARDASDDPLMTHRRPIRRAIEDQTEALLGAGISLKSDMK
jgi:hypothetical protein